MRVSLNLFIFIFLSLVIISQAKDLIVPKPFGIELRKTTKQEFHSKFGCKEKAFYYANLNLDTCYAVSKPNIGGLVDMEVAFMNNKIHGVTLYFYTFDVKNLEKVVDTIDKKYELIKEDKKNNILVYRAGNNIFIFIQPAGAIFLSMITYATGDLIGYISDLKRKKDEIERKKFDENF